jgi:phosphoribosylaminoimidazolecarboxamide formyltransferase / IMP cyclohydrolase
MALPSTALPFVEASLPVGARAQSAPAIRSPILGAIAREAHIESGQAPTDPGAVQVRRALLSVSDKRGIVDFARGLAELGIELVSTGGTAGELTAAGLDVRSVEDLTGFPEIMDGRVKTLHPKLYAGVLAVRSDPEHLRAAADHEVEFVDLVCVNLYPFERVASRRGVDEAEVIENIDIGGPTMIRAAAKNFAFTIPVVRPESYDAVLAELRDTGGTLSMPTRESLAAEAFAYTARYDTAIARWFAEKSDDFPALYVRAFEKVVDLPYGENPHQRGAYYSQVGARMHVLSMVRQHHGKQLSFNNILDLDSARRLVSEFEEAACAIVKHNNPCGCAIADSGLDAYRRAFECDPLSAFGGVIAVNRPVDRALAEALNEQFVEVLFAPSYDDDALALLMEKPNVRLLQDDERRIPARGEPDVRQVAGGLLVQDRDAELEDREAMEVVTNRAPTEDEWQELLFAWRVARHVRSNAIVIAKDRATAGIGAGQMSRVDSVRLALEKSRLESFAGAVLASDAFFPFADGPALAFEAGVSAMIQPGGSVRDDEVVAAADDAGAAMVFTRRRHFRH